MVPRVTVVVPFRDAVRWLPCTLASLASQQGVSIDLVAVDDGSSDGSVQLIRQTWPFPARLRILRSNGRGVSTARNLGWRTAETPFVAFLDADDLCLQGRLAAQVAQLQRDPGLAHVLCGWIRIDEGNRVLATVRPWQEGAGFSLELAFRHKAVLPSAWMLRRSALESCGGFDPGLSQAEDVDLLIRLARADLRGIWWRQIGCAYRVHPGGAHRRIRWQARSLQWVVNRHLKEAPKEVLGEGFRREMRYTTRAWAGWNAWRGGDSTLALELWRTSLGLSPLPPALTWVHLAENAARSAEREGEPFEPGRLLEDPCWHRLQDHWQERLRRRRYSRAPLPPGGQGWALASRLLLDGRSVSGMHLLRQAFLQGLGPEPEGSVWHPARLRQRLCPDDPLLELRSEVLDWFEALLGYGGREGETDALVDRLADLLWNWACLTWGEDRRPTARRLEECAALRPASDVLRALARLHRPHHPVGGEALRRLAEVVGSRGDRDRQRLSIPDGLVFWEYPGHSPDQCIGPACRTCPMQLLEGWSTRSLDGPAVLWQPPACHGEQPSDFTVEEHPQGQAWIRSPLANPWGLTHAVGVADRRGEVIPHLSRRYPVPWPGCPHPGVDPEPIPSQEPLHIEGVVLAVADLSAEGYYHWLLEALPRIGLALDSRAEDLPLAGLKIWHNGGGKTYVREGLLDLLGLTAAQLIDAHRHPHIRADRLLVPSFPSRFGWPSAQVRDWLRKRVLSPSPSLEEDQRLWLNRSNSGRRQVWGQRACVERLSRLGFIPFDAGEHTLCAQARQIASASCIVAPHGAALANLVFATPGARVLELHQPGYAPPYFHALAALGHLTLARCQQIEVPPPLHRSLLYEGPSVEPIVLEPIRVELATRALLSDGSVRRSTEPPSPSQSDRLH